MIQLMLMVGVYKKIFIKARIIKRKIKKEEKFKCPQ